MNDNKELIQDLRSLMSKVKRKQQHIQRNLDKHLAAHIEMDANRYEMIAWSKELERRRHKLVRWMNVSQWLSEQIEELKQQDKK